MFIDIHCHLPDNYFFKSIENHLKEWREKKISYVISVSQNYQESLRSLQLAEQFQEIIPAIGIHPWQAGKEINELSKFEKLISNNQKIKILGEIGLDYHFITQKDKYRCQVRVLEYFFGLAEKYDLRLMLHVKDAEEDVSEFIESSTVNGNKCCIHWFSGSNQILRRLIDSDCYFSCGPALNYSIKHQQVLKNVPLDRLLTESDGNMKYRGKLGHPGLIPEVVMIIADILDRDIFIIQKQLFKNSLNYLNI